MEVGQPQAIGGAKARARNYSQGPDLQVEKGSVRAAEREGPGHKGTRDPIKSSISLESNE